MKSMSAKDLHTWLTQGEDCILLDVRPAEEIKEWKIQQDRVPFLQIPYDDFQQEGLDAWKALPADKKISVICRRGRTARLVGEILDAQGFDTWILDRGMQEWSEFYHAVTVAEEETFRLLQIQRLGKGCLSYMIISGGLAMVVDPGRHVDEYVRLAEQEGAKIAYIMDTHLHADHITGAHELKEKTGAIYCISSLEMQGSPVAYEPVEAREEIRLGDVSVKVLLVPTPGHTPGSVSFLVGDRYLLSGDTVFVGGLGRPDLGGKAREWAQNLYETVSKRISQLPDDLLVLPAHFSDLLQERHAKGYIGAELGDIRLANEALTTSDPERFLELVVGQIGATPPNYNDIVQINRGLEAADTEKRLELEAGPNRCAVKHLA